MTNNDLLTLCGLAFMSMGHIGIRSITSLNFAKTHYWVSFGAGVSVAYVFIHVFPEIGIFQQQILGHSDHHQNTRFLTQPLYLAALGGLFFLYILDTIEVNFGDKEKHILKRHKYSKLFFIIKAFLYLLYNIMIAYIITQRPGEGLINILLISVGLLMHFIIFNIKFYEVYGDLYHKFIRWISTTGLLLGWIFAISFSIPKVIEVTIFSFIGGIITYVALKNELEHTKNKAPFHFLAGALIYSIVLFAIPYFGISKIAPH